MSPTAPSSGPRPASCDACLPRRTFLREAALFLASVGFTAPIRLLADEAVYPVPAQDGVVIDREREVVLARYQQTVYAFALSCPHQKTPLRWADADHRFQCPKHKSAFQPDGTLIDGRATRAMDRHPIRRDGANVVVDLATVYHEDAEREKWVAALVRL